MENMAYNGIGDKMNRCISCIHFNMVFIRRNGRYMGSKDSFCGLHKKAINKDGCCEMWQERNIDQELYAQKHISAHEDPSILIIDFDELLTQSKKG